MNTTINTPVAAVMALILLCMPAQAWPESTAERLLQTELPADGVSTIILKGGDGSADISVGDDDTIRIRVEIRPDKLSDREPINSIKSWFLSSEYDDLSTLMGAIELQTASQSGGRTKIGLSPSIRARDERVREKWHITVPKRVAVHLDMADAVLTVDDVAGGVGISIGHGSADVDVPQGDLDINVTVGRVRVRTGSTSVGRLLIKSQVGDTDLSMNGIKMEYPDPPGPGSHVTLSGDGDDDIEIHVQVGDASLRVNDK